MKKLLLILFVLVFFVGCTLNPNEDQENDDPDVHQQDPSEQEDEEKNQEMDFEFTDPVETQTANTSFEAAFENQHRAPGIITTTPLKVDVLFDNLSSPWGMDQLPSGELLITEKGGRLLLVSDEISVIESNFSNLIVTGQGGLLDVAVSHDFEQSNNVFLTMSLSRNNLTFTALMKGQLSDDLSSLNNIEVIVEATPGVNSVNHYGSRVIVDNNGNLFMSTGDRQISSNRQSVQDVSTGHGKIIHVDRDGNPIMQDKFDDNQDLRVYAYGLRNAQGLAFDHDNNVLYVSDMGPRGGDEVNIVTYGDNFGWPLVSYGTEYNGALINDGLTQLENTMQPMYYWDPAVAPSGMAFYSHAYIQEWENDLFVASLVQRHLIRLKIMDGKVIGEERLLEEYNDRIRDVLVLDNGYLLAISDSGVLYQISKE